MPRKTVAEKAALKRKLDAARAKTRINIGSAFERWRRLKLLHPDLKNDEMVAEFLLERYESDEKKPPPSAACPSDRDEVAVEEELDNSNSKDTSDQPMGASIEMEWNPNEEADPVSEDDQMGSEEDSLVDSLEEDEISEEDVNCNDDSDDADYRPPNRAQIGDALRKSGHKSRHPSAADKRRKLQCEDTVEKLEALRSTAAEDSDVDEQINMTETQDDSIAAPVESVGKQNCHEKPAEKSPEISDQQEASRRRKTYNCSACGRPFPNNGSLRRHLVIHSGKRPYKCFICARGFTQSGNLKTHMKVHKGEVPNLTLIQEKKASKIFNVKAHVCGDCGMDCLDQQQLEEHRGSHKRPYECSDCGRAFKNEAHFKLHQRMHSGEVNFVCSKCGKRWPTMESLKKHQSTHVKEKNFLCDQCGKAFSKPSALKQHLRTHVGERKYLCTLCGKSYSSAHSLKVHMRVHSGEKPYVCDKCGKGFYYAQGYQKHLQIHDKKPKPQTKPLGRPKRLLLEVNG